jgi:hypothetical protein
MGNNQKTASYKGNTAKIMLCLMVMLMAFSLVSASFLDVARPNVDLKIDKVISESANKYPAISIRDNWDLPLISKTKADLILTKHTESCSGDCMSEFDITTYEDTPLVDNITFLKNESGRWIESSIRGYQFYIQTSQKETEVIDYENKCEVVGYDIKNNSEITRCDNVKVGTHIEITPEYTPYNIGDVKPKGTYTVKLEGQKRADWTYDWRITTQGKLINDWSIWYQTVISNTDLISYWKMDESSGNLIDSLSLHNLTNHGTVIFNNAKINNGGNWSSNNGAYYFNSIETTPWNFGTGNFTISFWIKHNSVNSARFIMGTDDNWLADGRIGIQKTNTHKVALDYNGGNAVTSTTTIDDDSWHLVVFTREGITTNKMKVYIDGNLDATGTNNQNYNSAESLWIGGGNAGITESITGLLDEVSIWKRALNSSEISVLYNSNIGLQYPFLGGSTITLNSPANNTISPTNLITFNATANVVGGSSLVNMSLLKNGVINQTKTITGAINTTTFNLTLADGSYNWSIKACDSDGACGFSENRTVYIDTIAPTINISYPTSIINYGYIGKNETLNYSITDTNIDSCWYNYNNTNTTIPCNANSSFILTSQKNLTMYANDTAGNSNSLFKSWDYVVFENSVSYNAVSYETSRETFTLNYSGINNILSSQGDLYYNGTVYPSTISCSGTNCIASNSIDIPILSTGTQANYTFYWILTTFDGTNSYTSISSTNIQQVNQLTLTKCSAGIIALNFTANDEQNYSRINPFLFDATFNYYTGQGNSFKTLTISNATSNEIDLCINQNTIYYIDAIIAYSAPNSSIPYTLRNHFYQKYLINNVTKSIPLLLLKTSSSTSFVFNVIDSSSVNIEGILVNAQKCYPGNNSNVSALIVRTNSNGLTVGNLESEVALYQFFITNQSQTLLAVTPCSVIVPQTTPYTLTFQLGQAYVSPWFGISNITNLNQTLVFNSTSKVITFTYIDTSGIFNSSNLIVKRLNYTGNTQPIICNVSGSTSSGILSCNVTNGGSYVTSSYVIRTTGRNLVNQLVFVVNTISTTLGYYGVFLGWFIILICAFAFKFNEIAGIVLINAGLIFCNLMGLINFGWTSITAILLISITIIGILER